MEIFKLIDVAREDKQARKKRMVRWFRFFDAHCQIIICAEKETEYPLDMLGIGALCQSICLAALHRIAKDAGTRLSREPADAVRGMAAKLQTEEGKEIESQRKKIVEPAFGQVKSNLGFSRFRLRGLDKAGGEWTLVCLVHNMKKIYARIMARGGELDGLTEELQAGHPFCPSMAM